MPVASSLRELIRALRSKKTRTMYALDELFGSKQALDRILGPPPHPHLGDLRDTPHVLDTLPGWAVDELTGASGALLRVAHRLSDAEIEHIDRWPANDKEQLRLAVKDALDTRQPLHFFWELHGGTGEAIRIAGSEVTFRSPQQNANLSGLLAFVADITADVRVEVSGRSGQPEERGGEPG